MCSKGAKLHLGCGSVHLPGFISVDRAAYEHIDFQQDVRDLSNFGDKEASLIYACHVLEYFDLREAVDVLREWRRVLEPGGVLRLAVPDFDALLKVYWASGSLPAILGPLYGRMVPAGNGGRVIYHRTVYTFPLLSTILSAAGFRGIRRYNWRDTGHASVDDCSQAYWPDIDDPDAILVSLNVEAVRAE